MSVNKKIIIVRPDELLDSKRINIILEPVADFWLAVFWALWQIVVIESRAILWKTALCEGLRDRFDPRIAEARI